jgi:hypothetical protein
MLSPGKSHVMPEVVAVVLLCDIKKVIREIRGIPSQKYHELPHFRTSDLVILSATVRNGKELLRRGGFLRTKT